MSLSAKIRRAPMRAVTGAFILSSGVAKLSADEQTARAVHGMASGTYGFLDKVDAKLFTKGLAAGELALGGALLLPVVSPVVAGAGLMGFSGALLNVWWHTPGMHEEGSPKPTQAGIPIAKDVWMFGIGAGLLTDGLLSPAHDKKLELATAARGKRSRRAKKVANKATKKARKEALSKARDSAQQARTDATKRARKATKKALKRAKKSDAAKRAKQLSKARNDYASMAAKQAKHARSAAKDASHRLADSASDAASTARGAAQQAAGRAQQAVR